MKKVILTKGLPGSGKSTWAKDYIAKNTGWKRVNKDDLRAMIDNGAYSKDNENFVLTVRDNIILSAVKQGYNIIVDDTNLVEKHINHIKELVIGLATVEIKDFTDVPLKTCIAQDLKRYASVGEAIIKRMYKDHIEPLSVESYTEDASLPKAIIVDIDGTLAKMDGRSPFDWSKVGDDKCNTVVKNIVNSYNGTVIIFSGRDSVCREETVKWLSDNGIAYDGLFMRPEKNQEKDAIIKRRMFDENVKGKFFIEYVLDDRNQVVEMWRNMGLTCLQVAEGDF